MNTQNGNEVRIQWNDETRQKLAEATASLIKQWGRQGDYNSKILIKALREVMPTILPTHEQKEIGGPSRIPWFTPMVRSYLGFTEEKQKNSDELILDVLTSIEDKMNNFIIQQKIHDELIHALVDMIKGLSGEINHLNKLIIRKRNSEKAATPIVTPKPVTVLPNTRTRIAITIAGIIRGEQKSYIENAMKGFNYNIRITFDDTTRGPSQIPKFDHLIVMHWVSKKWGSTAMHLFPGKTHHASGIKHAIDLIHILCRRQQSQ